MTIEFDYNLITKNELIDSQHKELIDKINNLVESCQKGANKEEAVKMLDYLSDYTVFHFSAEEKLQEQMGYPDIDRHKNQHAAFVESVGEMKEKLEKEGASESFADTVNKNVTQWLYNHIKVFDRAFVDFKPYIGSESHPENMG